jgi:Rad3-related DNA helicase
VSILDCVPAGWQLRPEQHEVLLKIQESLRTHDVLVIVAPTAFGKTLLEYVIAKYCQSLRYTANIMAPSNVIVEQIHGVFPDVRILRRKDSYETDEAHSAAREMARAAKIRLMNFHVCFSNRLSGSVHILDEGHTTVEMLQDNHEVRIWQREYQFPDGMQTVADVIEWAQTYAKTLPDGRARNRLLRAIKDIVAIRSDAALEYRQDIYRGRLSKVLVIIPGLTRKAPDWLWPKGKVKKLVFLSATIGPEDIRELGLAARRVKYIECPSPIPPTSRPVFYRPWLNMGRLYQATAMPEFSKRLLTELERRPEKGLVHLPYNLALWLHEMLGDRPRLMWHDRDNKIQVLEEFKASPPEEGKVLVASGLYEGVDLPLDAARWQVIGKVPYLSLGDEKIKKRAEAYPQWFIWEALKRIIQATGRIVRGPDDFGETLIWDVNFERLLRDARRYGLVPKYFNDAVRLLPR